MQPPTSELATPIRPRIDPHRPGQSIIDASP
jgi:hypothetical protein